MIPRILICTPIVQGMGPRAYLSHIAMYKHIGKSTKYVTSEMAPGPRKSIREIRNRSVEEAIAKEATHLFLLDDDIIPFPHILDSLLEVDRPIVGGLIHNTNGDPLVWEGNSREGEWFYRNHPICEPFQCWAVASGAMLIQVPILTKLAWPWFWFERTGRTMDVNFCRAINGSIGDGSVWCDGRMTCGQIDHDERVV